MNTRRVAPALYRGAAPKQAIGSPPQPSSQSTVSTAESTSTAVARRVLAPPTTNECAGPILAPESPTLVGISGSHATF